MTRYQATTYETFVLHYEAARVDSPQVAAATSPPAELDSTGAYYVAPDHLSGYGVADGELVAVWSLVRGRGDELLRDALWRGAERLSCFDGYLRGFYERHGFVVLREEPNWLPGGPPVLFMHHTEAAAVRS